MTDWDAFYNKVYDILAEHVGAHEHYREFFVQDALREKHQLTEWRFCGSLGFGGKIWRSNGKVYVNCYSEDKTPEREILIERVNRLLKEASPPQGVWGPPEAHERFVRSLKDSEEVLSKDPLPNGFPT